MQVMLPSAVLAFNPQLASEGHLAGTVGLALGIVNGRQHLRLFLGVIIYHHLHRVEDSHAALGHLVEVLAQRELQQAVVDDVVALGHADALAESADALGRVAATAETADSRHAGVVPAADVVLLHQLQQLALAHHRVVDVEAGELVLVRGPDAQLLDEPVVERTVDIELQRADTMGDMLNAVTLAVGVVVHRVDAPLVARAVVVGMEYAVHDGIAEHHVGVRHVDLGAQHLAAVGELAGAHAAEQVEVLLDAAVAVGAVLAGRRHRAAPLTYLVEGLVVDVSQAFLYQKFGPLVELFEIVGGIVLLGPVEAQPVDVLLDGVDILGVLLDGVGVVEAQVGLAAVLLRQSEINAYRLGVADVQVAVGFRRETGLDGGVLALVQALFDNLFKKIQLLFSGIVFFHNDLIYIYV